MREFLRNSWARSKAWLTGRRSSTALAALSAVAAVWLFSPHAAHAATLSGVFDTLGSVVFMILARVFQALASGLGKILIFMVGILINVAQYNHFVDAPSVALGWVLVRDITNMFYIMVLLLIAFGTMLGIDQYSYKNKTVTKLLIAAVIVNFSRTFCGLLIDGSQVVMLTFVYGFAAAGGGNFLDALQLSSWMSQNANSFSSVTASDNGSSIAFSAMLGMMLACILAFVSLVVVIYMTMLLIMRIIYVWCLVILSPAAFFLRAVPLERAKKYYSDWWGEFVGQLVFGPVMALFLWLSLAVVAKNGLSEGFGPAPEISSSADLTAAWSVEILRSFLISIALLVGGTSIATKIAGETAKRVEKVLGKASTPVGALKLLGGRARGALGLAAAGAGKVSIPAGALVRDETGKLRRESVQLGALAGAGLAKVQGTGVYKSLGLDKDYNKLKATEERARAYAATGQTDKANALREELYAEAGKKLPRDKALLRKKYESELKDHKGSIMQRAAALKLAEAGMLELSEVSEASGSDMSLKKTLTDALKKSGKVFAGIDASKKPEALAALEDLYAASSRGEKTKFARQAVEGLMNGRDNKPRDGNAEAALGVIDVEDFKEFPGELKKKLLDALEAGIARAPAGSPERAALEAQRNLFFAGTGLRGSAADFATAENARKIKEQGLLVGAGATAKAFQGLDPETGDFENPEYREAFNEFMKTPANRKAFVKSLDKGLIMANGGKNDLALAMVNSMQPDELAEMAGSEGDFSIPHDNLLAVVQAARANANQGYSEQADAIVKAYENNDTALGSAFSDRTYKYEVGRFTAQTVGGVARLTGGVAGAAAAAALGPTGVVVTPLAASVGAWLGNKIGKAAKTAGEHRNEAGGVILANNAREWKATVKAVRGLGRGVQRTGMKV